ncbi:MAG: hypothetical protein PHH51_02310 [Bacilli bacterium]|nr:hypothetical protein [Bacilli bacterium]MDD3896115.1 hypothetical protein [Bacilli bacterium]MDD4408055.1 hypothetical protein [Bacilli bacterium]
MENLMFFLITFIIFFIIFLISYFIKRKKGTIGEAKELNLLIYWFKLKRNDLDNDRLVLIFTIINSLIISITATVCTMVKINYVWQILIGFVMVMSLMYISYAIVGKIILMKRGRKNGKHSKN